MASLRKRLLRGDIAQSPGEAAKVDESFVVLGTPLPSLLGRHDPNEGRPVWEQEVRDEQGRRRFHGAFTGGWSAGYYNTVGSKEGWQPKTFLSSRKHRERNPGDAAAQQRPEDFMDDEDLAEIDAQRHLNHRTGYTASSAESTSIGRHANDDVLGDLLGLGRQKQHELERKDAERSGLVAPSASMGHKILTRMGWKPGMGLGAAVSREKWSWLRGLFTKDPTSQDAQSLFRQQEHGRLAPPDTPMPELSLGTDAQRRHGLGWEKSSAQDDSDDIDSQQRRSCWKDGKPTIDGFVIPDDSRLAVEASKKGQSSAFAVPPVVPSGWKPNPFKFWTLSEPSTAARSPTPSQGQIATASTRARLLGEAQMPGPPPVLSNYMPSQAEQSSETERYVTPPKMSVESAAAALRGFLPFADDEDKQQRYKDFLRQQAEASSAGKRVAIPAHKTRQEVEAELDEFVRSASIFKPLGATMASRFASAQTAEGGGDVHAPLPGLHRPTPRSRSEIEAEAKERQAKDEERLLLEREEAKTEAQKAATAGLFGPATTRIVKIWHPARLLCKRFGVAMPHAETKEAETRQDDEEAPSGPAESAFESSGRSEKLERSAARREIMRGEARWAQSKKELMDIVGERNLNALSSETAAAQAHPDPAQAGRTAEPKSLDMVGIGEVDESQLQEIQDFVKPSRSIFKSVFADDEDDEEAAKAPESSQVGETIPPGGPPSVAAPSALSTPLFIPRSKRSGAAVEEAQTTDGHPSRQQKRPKTKKGANKRGGALTFDLGLEEEEPQGPDRTKPKERQTARVRAADLF
ncbi:unnamed protein product [Parajaminaea phylloscopi]